jgi:SpoVK/Ycf46/Vps4 family AAA+-type ATPase
MGDAKSVTIEYDKMKAQIETSIAAFLQSRKGGVFAELPKISYEKGSTSVSFSIPVLTEVSIFGILSLMKNHLENVRVHAFGDGYYAFQAMNQNLFNTENILDNFKVELYGLTSNFKVGVSKKANLSQEEINLIIEIYRSFYSGETEDPASQLERLGASVYIDNNALTWSYIAGYEDVKKRIRESIILPLLKPEIYDSIAKLTRRTFESNRPKAILFEGPPGVGKTTIARIIAGEVKIPLVYLPIESIMSKWYGQSSQNLSRIFDYCEDLGNCILFLDEIDSLAGSRDSNMFEATRRILSVLLRRLDGIDAVSNTITIGATNRKTDLDSALISRFDQMIHFPLPNPSERSAIFSNYAKHLNREELDMIGVQSTGMSGRNIKDLCEYTERRWARKLIIQEMPPTTPPPDYYRYTITLWHDNSNDRIIDEED